MANDVDFFGNKIYVGDTVAFMKVGYRNMLIGIVIKKTAQMVEIEYTHENYGSGVQTNRQRYNQVIKKIKEEINEQ